MAHVFTFTVEVTLERESGKFVSRDEMADQLEQAIQDADPGTVDVDETTYNVIDWSVAQVS
jgi:hypothetical protein